MLPILKIQMIFYRLLSVLSAAANVAFLTIFFMTFIGIHFDTEETVLLIVAATMAVALLVMIAHLNLNRTIDAQEKAPWRSALWWAGPLAASAYLWWMAGKDRR